MARVQLEYGMKLFKHTSGKHVITAGIITDLVGPDDCGYVRGCNLWKDPDYAYYDNKYSPIKQVTLFSLHMSDRDNTFAEPSRITEKLHKYVSEKHKGIIALCFPARMITGGGKRSDFYCHFTFAFDGDADFAGKMFDEIEIQLKYLYNSDHDIRKKMEELSRENAEIREVLGFDDEVKHKYVVDKACMLRDKAQKLDKISDVLSGFV